MWWIGATALASAGLVLVLSEAPAEACSCTGTPILSPSDATNIPLNAVMYSYERNRPYEQTIELIAPSGETIQLGERSSEVTANGSRLRILAPAEPLSALTTYELGQLDYVTNRVFTTGSDIDEDAPAAPTIESLQLETVRIEGTTYGSSLCFEEQMGWHGRVIPRLGGFEGDTQLVLVELMSSPDGPTLDILPMIRRNESFYGELRDHTCLQRPTFPLTPGLELCARGIAYDAAGNVSEPGEVICATFKECGVGGLHDDWNREVCAPAMPEIDEEEGEAGGSGCSAASRTGQRAWLLLVALCCIGRRRERDR